MAVAQGEQQQQADNSMAMLWGIGLTFAVVWLLWYSFMTKLQDVS